MKTQKYYDSSMRDLACAILLQSLDDYRISAQKYRKKLLSGKVIRPCEHTPVEIELFWRSAWCSTLLDMADINKSDFDSACKKLIDEYRPIYEV